MPSALADDPRYKDQPLTAGAIRRLGDHYWSRRQYEAAVKCWKQVVANYTGQNDEEANVAANNVISWYVKNRDYAGYEAWLVNDRNRADAPVRKHLVERAYGVAWNGFSTDWEKYAAASEKDRIEKNKLKTEDMKAFYQYLKSRREWFDKAGDAWGYHELALQFLTSLWGDRVSREAAANDALALIKQTKDKTDADNKLARLVDFLNQQGQYERARYLLPMIQDKILALFKDYELLAHENKWAEATARLEEVEKGGNPQWKQRAVWNRAEVYKEHTGQYEKAIKLFEQINQPPGTLWEIQECYHRENKLKEALATLTEIEAMFPDDASLRRMAAGGLSDRGPRPQERRRAVAADHEDVSEVPGVGRGAPLAGRQRRAFRRRSIRPVTTPQRWKTQSLPTAQERSLPCQPITPGRSFPVLRRPCLPSCCWASRCTGRRGPPPPPPPARPPRGPTRSGKWSTGPTTCSPRGWS